MRVGNVSTSVIEGLLRGSAARLEEFADSDEESLPSCRSPPEGRASKIPSKKLADMGVIGHHQPDWPADKPLVDGTIWQQPDGRAPTHD